MIIISCRNADGRIVVSQTELAEQVLAACPEAVVKIHKGATAGVEVTEPVAVKWLMRSYTAAGKPRRD